MTRQLQKCALGASVALLLCRPVVSSAQGCEAPEHVAGAAEYNALVCDAVGQMRQRNYAAAARLLEKASALDLHEYPNFRALPRLSLAYARLGNVTRARRVLDEAAMTLEVAYRMVRCTSSSAGYALAGPNVSRVPAEVARAVLRRMCGEAFESMYEQSSVETLVGDLPLVELYREARLIAGAATPGTDR